MGHSSGASSLHFTHQTCTHGQGKQESYTSLQRLSGRYSRDAYEKRTASLGDCPLFIYSVSILFSFRGFFSRSFHGSCCFSCRGFSSCSSTTLLRTTGTRLLGSLVFCHVLVVVNQFDEADFCIVTGTTTQLDNAGVTTRTVSHFHRDFLEQLCYGIFILQVTKYDTARVGRIVLRLGDQRLNVLLQRFSLCKSRSDSFVLDQRNGHV